MGSIDREDSRRAQRIQRILDECIDRQAAGEAASYEELIAVHRDLMPELGEALRKLALIEQACRRAHEENETE